MELLQPADEAAGHERTLIRGALQLVASGGAPRVVVVGLRGGTGLLVEAVAAAAELGVRASVERWESGEAADLVVERHG